MKFSRFFRFFTFAHFFLPQINHADQFHMKTKKKLFKTMEFVKPQIFQKKTKKRSIDSFLT